MSHIDSRPHWRSIAVPARAKQGLRFRDLWFNGWRHISGQLGARQGEMFSIAIEDLDLPWNEWREREAIVLDDAALPVCTLRGGMKLTLLSPGP